MKILITPGDPDGIGPEIVWKTMRTGRFQSSRRRLFCVGAKKPFEKIGARVEEISSSELARLPANKFDSRTIYLIPAPLTPSKKGALLPGYQAGWAIETATRLIQAGLADALVTGPINKERLQDGGFPYSGHTDFLADLCDAGEVTMMLANEKLRISLVTTHIALNEVSRSITRQKIRRAVIHTAEHLKNWWGIPNPRIGVAALNPHAGEGGLFGSEEIDTISPELRSLVKKGINLQGPLPADTLFANHMSAARKDRFDAVVCMYHDQGLIPVKLLDFPRTVNVTLGLPIVRTSVDHGTAFDIAGKNKADPSSLQSAIELATKIVSNRRRRKGVS